MMGSLFLYALLWAEASSISLASSSPSPPLDVSVQTRNLPGTSDQDTFLAIRRRFADVASRGKVVKNTNVTLDRSWENVPLFSFNGININCTRCYIKGLASAQVTIDEDVNPGDLVRNVTTQIGDELDNLTSTAIDAIQNYTSNLGDEILSFDLGPEDITFDNYTIDADFDIDIPPLPECQLRFQFDGLEWYVQLGMTFEGTFTVPIFKSQTPMGMSFGQGLEIGVFLAVDLILSADSGLAIQSGFHIKFDDGIKLDIAMFSHEVSGVTFNGGNFEFLPVTVSVNNAVLKAILRVGVHAGISVGEPEIDVPLLPFDLKANMGIEVGVYAHVAELVTNIIPGNTDLDEAGDCKLRVREEYTLAVGAAAGATVEVLNYMWGPQPQTTVPLYYTTMPHACAISGSPSLAPTMTLAGRQALETTTTVTEVKYTGVSCKAKGLVVCPVSLQRTVVTTAEVTLTTAATSGVNVNWALTANTVTSPVEFGSAAMRLGASSGVPTSFAPPSETDVGGGGEGGFSASNNGGHGGLSNSDKVVIGVSVGVGVPVVAGLVAAIWFWKRKQRQDRTIGGPVLLTAVDPTWPGHGPEMAAYTSNKPTGHVGITVYNGT